MKIYYEQHPVLPERKAELRARGFRIVDAAFAPADWTAPDAIQAETETQAENPAPVRGRGRPRKAN